MENGGLGKCDLMKWHPDAVRAIVLSFNDYPDNYYMPPFKYVLIYTMVQDLNMYCLRKYYVVFRILIVYY
jgi:hypothetical protein